VYGPFFHNGGNARDGDCVSASGIGSDVMKPIAAPMVGGMITSTIH
jgi:hypothetical protein